MRYKRFENALLAVISLRVGLRIVSSYVTTLPDFDIGFNVAYISFRCGVLTVVLWGILLFLFRFMGKCRNTPQKSLLFK